MDAAQKGPWPQARSSRPRSVLIVEDNPAHMALAVVLLEKLGCAVLRACTAEEGIEIARKQRPDVVMLDIRLPGMDGLAATRALKADPATASIKVIVVTSFRDYESGSPIAAGANAFLRKPYHYRELWDALDALIGPAPEADGSAA